MMWGFQDLELEETLAFQRRQLDYPAHTRNDRLSFCKICGYWALKCEGISSEEREAKNLRILEEARKEIGDPVAAVDDPRMQHPLWVRGHPDVKSPFVEE